MHTYHPYRLMPSQALNVLCRLALVLEIELLTDMILPSGRRGSSLVHEGGGHVTCATEM